MRILRLQDTGKINLTGNPLKIVGIANKECFGMQNTCFSGKGGCFIFVKKRFNERFVEYLENEGIDKSVIQKIIKNMNEVNGLIERDNNLGKDYRIGHSYFCPSGSNINDWYYWYESITEHEILPLLEEYWYDNDDKVKKAKEILDS